MNMRQSTADFASEAQVELPPVRPDGEEWQRNIFDWLPPIQPGDEKSKKPKPAGGTKLHATITSDEITHKYGVPSEHLIKYVKGEIAEAESCQSLPFTLMMVIFYSVMVYMHDDPAVVNSVEDSIVHDVTENANFAFSSPWIGHKNIDDVNSIADFWSWVINGYLPLTFIQARTLSEGLDTKRPAVQEFIGNYDRTERGMYLNYNRIIGGVRMVQERSDLMECTGDEDMIEIYDKQCVGTSPYEIYPEMPLAFAGDNSSIDLDYNFWLWVQDDFDELIEKVRNLEVTHWLDDQTKKVQMVMPVYNGEYGLYTIVSINFYFSRGGHIWKRIIAMSTWSQWWHGTNNILVDAMWCICLLYIVVNESRKIHAAHHAGGRRGLMGYLSFWILIDWISVIAAMIIIGLFRGRIDGTEALNNAMVEMASYNEVTETNLYRAKAEEVVEMLEAEVLNVYYLRWLLGVYPGLNVMRLFKAFAAQPRLSIVTSTLSTAAIDLVHFLLVFASIFFSYAIFGIRLFGREVDGFTNFSRSINTCFRIMMGDFDWEELSITGRPEAMIWFVSYQIVIVLIMMNMLLAIVMDAYADCKAGMSNAETLFMEMAQSYTRFVGGLTGKTVSLKVVLAELTSKAKSVPRKFIEKTKVAGDDDGGDDDPGPKKKGHAWLSPRGSSDDDDDGRRPIVEINWLCKNIPKMRKEQAAELIECAIGDYYEENKEDANIDEMLTVIRKVNWSTKTLKRKMFRHAEHVMPEAVAEVRAGVKTDDGNKEAEEDPVVVVTIPHGAFPGDKVEAECRQGTATFIVPEGQKPGDQINMNISEVTIRKPLQFMDELNKCYGDLKKSQNWIGDCEIGCGLPALSTAARTAGQTCPGTLPGEPLEGLDEIQEWSVVQVLDNTPALLDACRGCGIPADNDGLRMESKGKLARVVALDLEDGTLKCRVPGVGDIWFAAGALSHPWPQEDDALARKGGRAGIDDDEDGPDGPSHEEATKQVHQLEKDITVGKQTVSEALTAVSELEWRLLREHEEKEKVGNKFTLLRKKVVALTRENRKLMESVRKQLERLSVITSSRDEYAELVQNLRTENERLRVKAGPLALNDHDGYSDPGGSHAAAATHSLQHGDRGRRPGGAGGRRGDARRGGNQLAVVSEDAGTSPDQVNLTMHQGAGSGRRQGSREPRR